MVEELIINITQEESRVAILEEGQVVELYIERKKDASLMGNIYRGKIIKVLPGMQSSFIDIGLEKAVFLHVTDIMTNLQEYYSDFFAEEPEKFEMYYKSEQNEKHSTIEDMLQEGQEIIVQVAKNPIGTKGARVTSYITLPGKYIVFMPNIEHIGISRRIEKEDIRENLKKIAFEIKPSDHGIIMRTASEDATLEEIKEDLDFLILLWEDIQKKKDKGQSPILIYNDLDLVFRIARDFINHNICRLVIDSKEEYEKLRELAKSNYSLKLIDKIELYESKEPIFDAFGIELDISKALGKKVWLKSGGYIIIDQIEAMCVIDVNTGKFVGKENLEETILKTNLEAVKEIAYQIRLRNLGGIIVIDFIDMERMGNREKVFNAFVDAMKKDKAKNMICNISEVGLIQMTRKRTRESLGRTLCTPCPYCEGNGFIKSAKTIVYEIFRKLKKINIQNKTSLTIKANPLIAELLSDEERQGIEEIENLYGIKIIVNGHPSLHQEMYEILL